MPWTNKHNIPETFACAIKETNSKYKHDDDPYHFSATELLQPTRIAVLKRRFRGKIITDVGDALFMADGNSVHEMLEEVPIEDPVLFKEQRFEIKLGDFRVSGQIDLYQSLGIISDWKRTSVFAAMKEDKPEWEQQLNIYAMLLREAGYFVRELHIYAILRDWTKGKVERERNYPPIGFIDREFPLWDDEKTRKFVKERIWEIVKNEDKDIKNLPLCTPEERWTRDEHWAVKKEGAKQATKRFWRSEDEAYLWIQDNPKKGVNFIVEHRPGINIRCQNYCDVKEYCPFWIEHIKTSG